ncbi:MAG: V-type ATP synthase subunit I [Candidatus Hodarchaeota archaeon]
MIETMFQTKIIGFKEDVFDFIRLLQKFKVLHVIETPGKREEGLYEDRRLQEFKVNLESLETRIASIFSHLPSDLQSVNMDSKEIFSNEELISQAENLLTTVEPKIRHIESEKRQLNSKIKHLKRYEPILNRIEPLIFRMEEKENLESVILMLDRRADLGILEFEKEVNNRTKGIYELVYRRVDENYFAVLLLFDQDFIKEIYSYLSSERISAIAFPPELRDVKLRDIKKTILELISKLETNRKSLEQEVQDFIASAEHIKLVNIHKAITERLNEFQLVEKMGGTEDTFEIEGFIPKSKMKRFESELRNNFGKRILITSKKANKEAPVLRKNPRIVRPFETITNLIQLPKYGSIDPTPLIFLLFPFFWGFMVGDIGYAVTIFLIAAILRFRFKKRQQQALQNISEIFMISCVVAIFFGIIYFEIFGDLGELIAHDLHLDIHPIINRYEAVQDLLIISIIVGYGIVMGGMVLGAYNNIRLRHMSHAYGIFFLIIIWGSIPILITLAIILPEVFLTAFYVDIVIILVAVLFLLKIEGIAGLIHVIEKFSNILSFARLMAIGLVGAWMGLIANDLTNQFFPLGLLMGLGLHLINIVILVLSPSIHAMRLNVYEFFSQFVAEGGNIYRPFGTN